jgi:hypothetical protein
MNKLLFHLQDDLNNKNKELWESLIVNPTILKRNSFIDEFCLYYLPNDCGIEIETELINNQNYSDVVNKFKKINNLKESTIGNSESKFRIPNGFDGFVCLYKILDTIKETHYNSVNSTHHYHIDMTDWFSKFSYVNLIENKQDEFLLTELDNWDYKYNSNKRQVAFDSKFNWVNFRHRFKTCEFRCSDSTFDYQTVILRLIHASKLVTSLKNNNELNIKVSVLKSNLNNLIKTKESKTTLLEIDMEQIIKSRLC